MPVDPPGQEQDQMISYMKKPDPQASPNDIEENEAEQIRTSKAARHSKADTDGTRRRALQKAEDNRLI
jgi:hypothetical protein